MARKYSEAEVRSAERQLIDFANDINRGAESAGAWRVDITEAKAVVQASGAEVDYRFENGRQVLYIGGVCRN